MSAKDKKKSKSTPGSKDLKALTGVDQVTKYHPDLKEIGTRFHAYLHSKKKSINKAAADMELHPSQIYNIIKGKNYGTRYLLVIANYYPDLPMTWLLRGKGDMSKDPASHPKKEERWAKRTEKLEKLTHKLEQEKDTLEQKNETLEKEKKTWVKQLKKLMKTHTDALNKFLAAYEKNKILEEKLATADQELQALRAQLKKIS